MVDCASPSSRRGASPLLDEADGVLIFRDGGVQGLGPQRDVGLQDRFHVGLLDDHLVAILDIGQTDAFSRRITGHEQFLPDLFFNQADITEPLIQQFELLGIAFLHRSEPPSDPEAYKGRPLPPHTSLVTQVTLCRGEPPADPLRAAAPQADRTRFRTAEAGTVNPFGWTSLTCAEV